MHQTNYLMTYLNLFSLAGKQRLALDEERGIYVPPCQGVYPYCADIGSHADLARFARDLSGCEQPAEAVLSSIVTPAAANLLRSMPNQYWFWTVLEASLAGMKGMGERPLDDEQVREGIHQVRERDSKRRSHFEYTHPRYETEQGLMAVMADSALRGHLLVVYEDGFPISVFDNPIFSGSSFFA